MSVELKRTERSYVVTKGNYLIRVTVIDGEYFCLSTRNGQESFLFSKSNAVTLRAIGELLIEASEIREWKKE